MTNDQFQEYKSRHTIRKRLTPLEIEKCLEDYFRLKKPVDDLTSLLSEFEQDIASIHSDVDKLKKLLP